MRLTKRSAAIGSLAVLIGGAAFAELLGILPGLPSLTFNSAGTTEYHSGTQYLEVRASPVAILFGAGQPPRFVNPTGDPPIEVLTVDVRIGPGGVLLGGLPGDDDLLVIGEVDATGNGVIDYAGVLLTGEVIEFGWEHTGTFADKFDFRFAVTGGELAGYFAGMDIGLVLTVENSTFQGHFDGDFGGGAKGALGPIPPKDDNGEIGGCTPGFWRQPHHFQYWVGYNPDDLFADAFVDSWGVYAEDPNNCLGHCGGQAESGCWCDDLCCAYADCCLDKFAVCGGCDPDNADGEPDGCEGACGGMSSVGCWCDELCCLFQDCCGDKLAQCGGCDPDAAPSCEGACGGQSPTGCWCDDLCCGFTDCCPDKLDLCGECDAGASPSCDGSCGGQSSAGCWCDESCCTFADCCADKADVCGGCSPGGAAGGSAGEGGSAGSFDPFPGKTLLEVLSQRASAKPGPNQLNNLGRHAVAALLNAAAGDYPYSVEEVIAMFNNAYADWLATGQHQVLNALKDIFEAANEAGCLVKDGPNGAALADLNSDGVVNIFDLLKLISNWGPVPEDPTEIYFGDVNDDGKVDVFDLLFVLAQWGSLQP